MRAFRNAALGFAVVVGVAGGFVVGLDATASALAQGAPTAPAANVAPKPVSLTQAQIDGAIAAQKDIRAIEAKQPQKADDKTDPKLDAQVDAIIKKNGFADMDQYAGVSATIGTVLAGIDPDTKAYIGPANVIKKQMTEVKADAKMPAKEKSEALEELNAALKTASSDKPSQSNIDLVSKNFDALSQGLEAE